MSSLLALPCTTLYQNHRLKSFTVWSCPPINVLSQYNWCSCLFVYFIHELCTIQIMVLNLILQTLSPAITYLQYLCVYLFLHSIPQSKGLSMLQKKYLLDHLTSEIPSAMELGYNDFLFWTPLPFFCLHTAVQHYRCLQKEALCERVSRHPHLSYWSCVISFYEKQTFHPTSHLVTVKRFLLDVVRWHIIQHTETLILYRQSKHCVAMRMLRWGIQNVFLRKLEVPQGKLCVILL